MQSCIPLRAAKQRGVQIGGSKPKISYDEVIKLKQQGGNISQIAKRLNCSRQTVYAALQRAELQKVS